MRYFLAVGAVVCMALCARAEQPAASVAEADSAWQACKQHVTDGTAWKHAELEAIFRRVVEAARPLRRSLRKMTFTLERDPDYESVARIEEAGGPDDAACSNITAANDDAASFWPTRPRKRMKKVMRKVAGHNAYTVYYGTWFDAVIARPGHAAMIFGHEIAHADLGHTHSAEMRSMAQRCVGWLKEEGISEEELDDSMRYCVEKMPGFREDFEPISQEREETADQAGLEFAAAAGYDVDSAWESFCQAARVDALEYHHALDHTFFKKRVRHSSVAERTARLRRAPECR